MRSYVRLQVHGHMKYSGCKCCLLTTGNNILQRLYSVLFVVRRLLDMCALRKGVHTQTLKHVCSSICTLCVVYTRKKIKY